MKATGSEILTLSGANAKPGVGVLARRNKLAMNITPLGPPAALVICSKIASDFWI